VPEWSSEAPPPPAAACHVNDREAVYLPLAMNPGHRRPITALLYGAPIGLLGGLIGLGGAEFRLPVLKSVFRYPTRRAVALNLAVSLVTIVASLAIRLPLAPAGVLRPFLPVILGLIGGSMAGAWLGASYASRIPIHHLDRLILILLTAIGLVLIAEGLLPWSSAGVPFGLTVRLPLAVLLGTGIGLISSLLGVAGGELIIPTLVLIFGAGVKIAGTASLLVSLPTVVVGLVRYHRKAALIEGSDVSALILPMGVGSVTGALAGGLLVSFVPGGALKVALGVILVISAVRIFRETAR
jgi:uncharacterized membrane protein YfcA